MVYDDAPLYDDAPRPGAGAYLSDDDARSPGAGAFLVSRRNRPLTDTEAIGETMSAVLEKAAATADDPAKMTDGFHLVIDALKHNDIDTIFGLVGIPITDLARLAQAEGMRFIGFRHEQHAGNAAAIAGYMTQKPGICLTVSAPGFLNGLTALANATTNCFPMILISGSSEREIVDLQQGDYEEMDQLNAAKPYAKAAYRINKAEDIGIGIARAIRAAVSGRPGGVYLDLPAQLLGQSLDAAHGKKSLVRVVDPVPRQIPAPDAVRRALDLLKGAKRPLILLGKGAAYAQADADIRAFVEKSGIPYLPMSMAKGLLPDTHPQSAAAARSFVLAEADVVVLIGARLNWLLAHGKGKTWGAPKQFIQVDISPTEIDSNVAIAAPVIGDIGSCVSALLAGIGSGFAKPSAEWTGAIAERKDKNLAKMAETLAKNPSPMNFHSALRAIRDVLKTRPDINVVNEGANTLDYARSIIDMYQPRKRFDSGTWGIMGIGMGYAIGAAVTSGLPVVAIEGDSAFGFSGMELETICRYELPITTVIFNNNGVYKGCDPNLNPNVKDDVPVTAFVKGARYDKMIEAFGGIGYNATTPAELTKALTEAIASGKPALINAVIDEAAGTESGRLTSLNPQSKASKK
jgi:oxalyl-CoA decarboxylase